MHARRGSDCPLTRRQLDVVALMADGLTYREMAVRLHITLYTTRAHMHTIYRLLGVDPGARRGGSRAVAVIVRCLAAGWLDAQPDPDPWQGMDERVTWAQRLYLEAFDQHLRAWAAADELGERRTRRMMDDALEGVLGEAGARPVRRVACRDPLERMAAALTRHS